MNILPKKFVKFLRSVYFIMPAITVMLIMVWVTLIAPNVGQQFDVVSADDGNILSNPSFEEWGDQYPTGWSISSSHAEQFNVSETVGHVDGSGLYVESSNLKDGALQITTPEIEINKASTYFFKSFYKTDTALSIVVEKTDKNDDKSYQALRQLPDYDYTWSSMSSLVEINEDIKSIKFIILMVEKGYIELDSAYVIDTNQQISEPLSSPNVLTGGWSLYKSGNSDVVSKLFGDVKQVAVSNHQYGHVGWSSYPISVKPHELYVAEFEYSSDAFVDVWVDFERADGSSFYRNLETLHPTPYDTKAGAMIEIPKDAVKVQLSLQLFSNGNLISKNFIVQKAAEANSFSGPKISVTFDDGWASSNENGAKILEELGYQGTFFVNPGELGNPEYMTIEDVKSLLERKHQIGSHTNMHIDITSYSHSYIKDDISKADKFLRSLNIDNIDFASPYGKYDHAILPFIMRNYATHRGTDLGVNTKQNYNPSNLKGLFVRKETTDSELRNYIERTKDTNGWLILIYHKIEPSDSPFDIDLETFKRHMDIVRDSGVQVQTVQDARQSL